MYASLESQSMPYLPGITLTNNIPKSDSNNSHYNQVDNDKNNKYINCKKMYPPVDLQIQRFQAVNSLELYTLQCTQTN